MTNKKPVFISLRETRAEMTLYKMWQCGQSMVDTNDKCLVNHFSFSVARLITTEQREIFLEKVIFKQCTQWAAGTGTDLDIDVYFFIFILNNFMSRTIILASILLTSVLNAILNSLSSINRLIKNPAYPSEPSFHTIIKQVSQHHNGSSMRLVSQSRRDRRKKPSTRKAMTSRIIPPQEPIRWT